MAGFDTMGFVVTAWDVARINTAHAAAVGIFSGQVSEVVTSPMNGYHSFFVAPDGSKEGWADSDNGDKGREDFKTFLRTTPELYCEWIEYEHDVDNGSARVVESSSSPVPETEAKP